MTNKTDILRGEKMLVYDHLKCPFCGTLNKFTRGNGRELDKFKCFYCHSWFEKQNDNKYIAVNDRNETKTAEKNFIYTPESCGVVLAVKIEGNKEKLPVATLSFAFGGTCKTSWCQSTLDRFKEGINSYTLFFDERPAKEKRFEDYCIKE